MQKEELGGNPNHSIGRDERREANVAIRYIVPEKCLSNLF